MLFFLENWEELTLSIRSWNEENFITPVSQSCKKQASAKKAMILRNPLQKKAQKKNYQTKFNANKFQKINKRKKLYVVHPHQEVRQIKQVILINTKSTWTMKLMPTWATKIKTEKLRIHWTQINKRFAKEDVKEDRTKKN